MQAARRRPPEVLAPGPAPSTPPPDREDRRPPAPEPRPRLSGRSRHALDGFVFFVADIQTGFGPFVSVFLTTQRWTQTDIGLVLTIGGLVGLFGQIPAGILVDAVKSKRMAAAIALIGVGISAFAFATWPIFPVVIASRVLHGMASCVLGLAMVSLTLSLVGRENLGARLGRNTAFASAGTGLAAAGMGLAAFYLSSASVFILSGALVIPAIFALVRIRGDEIGRGTPPQTGSAAPRSVLRDFAGFARNRGLVVFAGCMVLFHLANAAMLPLAASMLTQRSTQAATIMVAAAIVVPQFIVTLLSPWVGAKAQRWGRRPLLFLGFAALLLRGLLFSLTADPTLLVMVQILDGVSAAVLGVLVPLVIADVTRGGGHFNLAQGVVGCAMGIGAAISTTMTGYIADHSGSHTAFVALAVIASVALAAITLVMPETRPKSDDNH